MPVEDFHAVDPVLRQHLDRRLDADVRKRARLVLEEVGSAAAGPIDELAREANANPPTLRRYDKTGERVDEVDFHPAYEEMRERAYDLGLVWRAHASSGDGGLPRPAHFAACYLFAQAEQGLYCPIALTDGTALLVARYGTEEARDMALDRLLARTPEDRWEGAMFLTERAGGSDVGAARMTARQEDGTWRLSGRKWFCSNANADVWAVLARPEGAEAGTEGLALFLVPRRLDDGTKNGFRIGRLKDKLGTRSMATGEITFEGAEAILLGSPGEGFPRMQDMLDVTRTQNAVASAAAARRALVEAVTYARERESFGKTLDQHPLHRRVLLDLALEWEASLVLALEAGWQLERAGSGGDAGDGRAGELLRALTPLTKNLTARTAVDAASEACEALGGNGYIEEWVTPRLLRDAQVAPIWEGTTNILSLDTLRAAEEGAVGTLLEEVGDRLDDAPAPDETVEAIREASDDVARRFTSLAEAPRAEAQARARDLCFDLARTTCAALLAGNADDRRGELVVRAYVEKHLGEGNDLRTEVALEDYETVVDAAVRTPDGREPGRDDVPSGP